jgi:hypothetical protein
MPVAVGVAAVALAFSSPSLANGGASLHGGSSSDNGSSNGNNFRNGKPVTTTTSSPAPEHGSGALSVQGVVQSVSASAVFVRLLDGTATSVPYDRRTQVFVNGKSGHIADVKPGFVLAASWKAGKAAAVLRFVKG